METDKAGHLKLNRGIEIMKAIKMTGKMIEVPIAPELQEDYGTPDGTATEIVTASKLNKIPKDEFFKLTPEGSRVYLKVDYDRARKGYYCESDKGNERFIKSTKTVYIGFTF